MNRYFIKETEFGRTAVAILPQKDKVLNLFIGIDGSKSLQVFPYSHATEIINAGLDDFTPALREELLELFVGELKLMLLAFFNGNSF